MMSLSVPDPDELMDANAVDEPVDEHEHEFDLHNANDMDDDFGNSNSSPLPNASNDEQLTIEKGPSPQLVNCTAIDLESLSANYTGYALMNRLLFIADACPPMQKDALQMLISYVVENTSNVPMYMSAMNRMDSLRIGSTSARPAEPTAAETANSNASQGGVANNAAAGGEANAQQVYDTQWVETNTTKGQAKLDLLATEFKRQKDEGVKESTRRAMDDLFQQQINMGRLHDAMKLYSRGMREYCSSPKHVIQMLMNWIEVTIHMGQWQRVDPLISQVERSISEANDAETAIAGSTSGGRGSRFSMSANQAATKNLKELIETSKAKIAAVSALYRLHSKAYKGVIERCLQIDLDAFDYRALVAPKDIALYGTFCALATFSRAELKSEVLGSPLFRKFLESEPKLVELLQKFIRSEFGTCLDIMEEMRDQLLLNIYLSPHVKEIYNLIRRRAIVQYFVPYAACDVRRMAEVFRVGVDELENELFEMIQNGDIDARIDSFNRVLHVNEYDRRLEIYKKILALGDEMASHVNKVVLRAALHEAQIVVGHGEGGQRTRRRPGAVHGSAHTILDDFGISGEKSKSTTNGRSFMSRLFGSSRPNAPSSSSVPSGSSQAAEADSSNEVPSRASEAANAQSREDSSSLEAASVPQISATTEDVTMVAQNQSSDEQCAPSVPGVSAKQEDIEGAAVEGKPKNKE